AADENHPQNPIGIYGALKVAGEKLVIAYQQVFDLSYTIIRPSALYGPGCVSRRVSQVFIESAMSGGRLIVDGDGSSRLDFTYIDDLVQGIKLAIQVPAAKNETFNITYGRSRAVSELVQILQQHFPAVGVERVPRDRLTPERGTLTADKARGVLGYSPQFDLETGIGRYIDWYRQLRVGFESVADEPSPA
ncbi:MAG TPA: NAD(P)-dependent oxidoreductase, partial [Acidobacteriota bacterium]|nr:NAD(P)-dependent oxidoreductase [Acidobacteriota bacterium]